MLTMDKTDVTNGELLIERIDSYSDRVRKRAVPCAMTICPHCGLDAASAQTPFTCHGTRPRRFLVLVGSYVRKVAGLLARWRCPRCRRTFTDYPPFASPYKAYTLPQMTERPLDTSAMIGPAIARESVRQVCRSSMHMVAHTTSSRMATLPPFQI